MAWVTALPWQAWMLAALLIVSAAVRATVGQQYRDLIRELFLWWLPDPTSSLRPDRSAQNGGGSTL